MTIKDFGGEFALINKIYSPGNTSKDKKIIKGIGDDCAVIKYKGKKSLLVTTDMMVENDHFCLKWQTPFQIGMKLMEVNVSDIIAMGGTPKYTFISISIKKDTTVKFMEDLYKGIYFSANKHNVSILGGDTTHGTEYTMNITMLGFAKTKNIRYRNGAKIDDLICVTGNLGGSTAGLKLLIHNKEKNSRLTEHLEPKSRLENEGKIIAKYASSMIDVSDGLGSEVRHICEESNVGAVIEYDKIPITDDTFNSAKKLGMNAYDFALYGGEDFQIVFTICEKNIKKLKNKFSDFSIVGKILNKNEGLYLLKNNEKHNVDKGFDHFA